MCQEKGVKNHMGRSLLIMLGDVVHYLHLRLSNRKRILAVDRVKIRDEELFSARPKMR